MKQILVVAIALITSLNSFSQSEYGTSADWGWIPSKDTVSKNSILVEVLPKMIYENESQMLYKSVVFKFNSFTQKQVKDYFKNWASLHFNNFNAVNLGETDNQILIRYKIDLSTIDSVKIGEKKLKTVVGKKKNGKTKYKKIYRPIYHTSSDKMNFDVSLVGQFKDAKLKCMVLDDTNLNLTIHQNYRKKWEERISTLLNSIQSPLLTFDF